MVLFKTLIFTILVPGTVTVIVPYALVSRYPARLLFQLGLFRYVGVVLILVGAGMYLRFCLWSITKSRTYNEGLGNPTKDIVRRYRDGCRAFETRMPAKYRLQLAARHC